MRFHLVDRIIDYSIWEKATGVKNITSADELLEYSNESRSMTFPKTLLCESILQTCAWLIVKSSDNTKRPVILSFKKIDFLDNVKVGDSVRMHVEILSYTEEYATVSGCAIVDNREVLRFDECFISLLNTGKLEKPEDTKNMIASLFRED